MANTANARNHPSPAFPFMYGPPFRLVCCSWLEINILDEKNCMSRENPRASYSNCQKSEERYEQVLRTRKTQVSSDLSLVACSLVSGEKE